MLGNWLFPDPPNVAVIVDQRILRENAWIAHVFHDLDDGSWQFHSACNDPPLEEDAAIVSLRTMLEIDPSIEELLDLPFGWHAWRESQTSAWQRLPKAN